MSGISRREALAAMGGALAPGLRAARPAGYLVENALHMFAEDLKRFPAHPNAPYQPRPNSLKDYVAFVRQAKLDHTVTDTWNTALLRSRPPAISKAHAFSIRSIPRRRPAFRNS